MGLPDPELVERPLRRRFTAEYKLRILREAETCGRPGEIGALVRREGAVQRASVEVASAARRGRARGARAAARQEAGRPARSGDGRAAPARRVIEVQGNVSALLGELLEPKGAIELGSSGR